MWCAPLDVAVFKCRGDGPRATCPVKAPTFCTKKTSAATDPIPILRLKAPIPSCPGWVGTCLVSDKPVDTQQFFPRDLGSTKHDVLQTNPSNIKSNYLAAAADKTAANRNTHLKKERKRGEGNSTRTHTVVCPVQKKDKEQKRNKKNGPPFFVHTLVVLKTAPHFFFSPLPVRCFSSACDVPLHPDHLAVNLAAKASQSGGVSLLSTRKQIEPGRTTGPFVPSSLSCSWYLRCERDTAYYDTSEQTVVPCSCCDGGVGKTPPPRSRR